MNRIRAKYFNGSTPETISVEIWIESNCLKIAIGDQNIASWDCKKVFKDKANLSVIMLACEECSDARVEIVNAEDCALLAPFVQDLQQGPFKFHTKKMLIYFLGTVVFVGGIYFSVRPMTQFVASQVSIESERRLLDHIEDYSNAKRCNLNLARSFALEKLLSRIYPLDEEDKKLGIQVHVVMGFEENAFALPGGEIWIFSGLLKNAQSPEEIAGIIAHEIEHIKKRHLIENLVRGTLVTSLLSLAAGDLTAVLSVDPQTAMGILSLQYSREQEQQADLGAKERLRKAGLSTQGLIDFFERNKMQGKNIPKFLSTHPSNENRIKLLESDKNLKSLIKILEFQEWLNLKATCF